MSIFPKFRDKQGQASFEFLIQLSMALLTFTVFYALINSKHAEALNLIVDMRAKTIAEKISYELDLSVSQFENFTRSFEIPKTILGKNYTVSLLEGGNFTWIYVNVGNSNHTAYSVAPSVVGSIKAGKNILENRGGTIYVS